MAARVHLMHILLHLVHTLCLLAGVARAAGGKARLERAARMGLDRARADTHYPRRS
jgi:hypothetical protein